MMPGFGFLILFGLSCMLFPCEGQVKPPTGTILTFLNGSTAKINWSFGDLTGVLFRLWSFTSSDGVFIAENLAKIDGDKNVTITTRSFEVDVEKPATLVLKNVNQSYDGTYKFSLSGGPNGGAFEVVVFIAERPTAIVCSSPVRVDEGHNATCLCRAEGGNPPANVTWYDKDGVQIGETKYGPNNLTLTNVSGTDSGTYKCVAQSYTLTDEKSIKVIVYFKPKNTNITFTQNPAEVDEEVTITCESDALPSPSYTIFHNDTRVSTDKTYPISKVKRSHAGTYKCISTNKLGNDSASANLTVVAPTPPPPSTITPNASKNPISPKKDPPKDDNDNDGGLGGGVIAGIIIGVLVLIVIVVIVVYCFCCKSGENLIWKRICSSEMEDENGASAGVVPRDGRVAENHYELENEQMAGENAYDTVNASGSGGASGSKSKPPQETPPVVYAQVDKENRQGKPLYATLDTVALESGSSQKRDDRRPPPSEYASIDHGRVAEVPRADLV